MQENKQEKKENVIVKHLKGIGYDFIQSFKYNNMKLAGLLLLIPGAIFGFFLTFHTHVVNDITVDATNGGSYMVDLSGLMLFLMMLFGILNIFSGFSVMNKKNLGSVILALVTSIIMVVAGVFYFVIVFRWMGGVNAFYGRLDEVLKATGGAYDEQTARQFLMLDGNGNEVIEPITGQSWYVFAIPAAKRVSAYFNVNYVMSLGSIALCIVCSIVGIILAFKNYDRNYEKVDR